MDRLNTTVDVFDHLAWRARENSDQAHGFLLLGPSDEQREWVLPPLVSDLHYLTGDRVTISVFSRDAEARKVREFGPHTDDAYAWFLQLTDNSEVFQDCLARSTELLRELDEDFRAIPGILFFDLDDLQSYSILPLGGLEIGDLREIFGQYYSANARLFKQQTEIEKLKTELSLVPIALRKLASRRAAVESLVIELDRVDDSAEFRSRLINTRSLSFRNAVLEIHKASKDLATIRSHKIGYSRGHLNERLFSRHLSNLCRDYEEFNNTNGKLSEQAAAAETVVAEHLAARALKLKAHLLKESENLDNNVRLANDNRVKWEQRLIDLDSTNLQYVPLRTVLADWERRREISSGIRSVGRYISSNLINLIKLVLNSSG